MAASSGTMFTTRDPPPVDKQALMEPWFKHRYLVYLQRIQQGGAPIGGLCSCTLGIQQNVYDRLPQAQQAQVAEIFRAAEGAWATNGPKGGFAAPQTRGGGRPVFPLFLAETPHQGATVSSSRLRGAKYDARFVCRPVESSVWWPSLMPQLSSFPGTHQETLELRCGQSFWSPLTLPMLIKYANFNRA